MIRRFMIVLASSAALGAAGVPATAAERPKAKTECAATDKPLVYDCTITLSGRKSGAPIEGAKLVVNADMPAMPMAHNVKPVTATPAGTPGVYRVRLTLEMHGEWLVKIRVSGPTRDLLVEKLMFGPNDGKMDGMKGGHKQH